MRYLFNGCIGLVALKDRFYTFASCGNLATILVDTTRALASSASAYGYAQAVIDEAGQVGN